MFKKFFSIFMMAACVFGCFLMTACSGPSKASVSVGDSLNAPAFDSSGTIDETTLVDNESVTVIANSLSYSNNRALLNVSLTNKSTSELSAMSGTLGFSANYINSYMVPGYLYEDIKSGETVTADIAYQIDELRIYGIDKIAEIGLGLAIEDDDFNYVVKDVFPIKTSLFDSTDMSTESFQKSINDPALRALAGYEMLSVLDEESFNQNGLSIESVALIKNKDDETIMLIEIKNDSNDLVRVTASDVMINDEMVYEGAWTGDSIASKKTCVMDIKLNSMLDDDENVDINNVKKVSFEFAAQDSNRNTLVSPVEIAYEF